MKYPIESIDMDKLSEAVRELKIYKVAQEAGVTREGLSKIINSKRRKRKKRVRVNAGTFEAVVYAIGRMKGKPLTTPLDFIKSDKSN